MNFFKKSASASFEPGQKMALYYYYDGCPFCSMVMAYVNELGIDLELRNIMTEPSYRRELVEARGRGTVPVLRIEYPSGDEHWMPESRDIAKYLQDNFQSAAA